MITDNGPIRVSPSGLELWAHGTPAFPCGCYQSDLHTDEVPWHWHGELEFGLCKEGSILYSAGGERFRLAAGDATFVNGGVPHTEVPADAGPSIEGSLVCRPEMLYGTQESSLYQNYFRNLLTPNAPQVVHLDHQGAAWQREAAELVHRAHVAVAGDEEFYDVTARELLTRVCLIVQTHAGTSFSRSDDGYERSMGRMKNMLAFIEEHVAEDIGVGEIAAAAGVSEREAQREFRAVLGSRPVEYLTNYRLYLASQRLRTSDDSVGAIAREVGFSSQSYFTKRFRDRYGHSPSAHRRQ